MHKQVLSYSRKYNKYFEINRKTSYFVCVIHLKIERKEKKIFYNTHKNFNVDNVFDSKSKSLIYHINNIF